MSCVTAVIPAEYYPSWAKEALKWHIQNNDDHLVSSLCVIKRLKPKASPDLVRIASQLRCV